MDGLTLDRALKSCSVTRPYYKGIYSIDTVPPSLLRRAKTYPFFVIVNTGTAGTAGKHWLVYFYLNSRLVEIFDSLGQSPYAYGKHMKQFIVQNTNVKFNYVNKRLQSLKSNVCGAHCLFFAYKKCYKKLSLAVLVHRFYLDDPEYNDCRVLCFAKTRFHIRAQMISQMLRTTRCNLNECANAE